MVLTFSEMTIHASEDRLERIARCIETLGMGTIAIEAIDARHENTIRCMTTTGIIFVRSVETGKLITGYMASVSQMFLIYRQAQTQIPKKIYRRVHKNNQIFSFLHEIGEEN